MRAILLENRDNDLTIRHYFYGLNNYCSLLSTHNYIAIINAPCENCDKSYFVFPIYLFNFPLFPNFRAYTCNESIVVLKVCFYLLWLFIELDYVGLQMS